MRPFAAKGVRSMSSGPGTVPKDPLAPRTVKSVVTDLRVVLWDLRSQWDRRSGDRPWCRALETLVRKGAKSAATGCKAVLRDP